MNFGRAGASLAIKVVFGLAIAAAAAAVATEVAITGSVNPAGWGRQVNHQVTFAADKGPALSVTQQAASMSGHSETTVIAGSANARSSVNTNDSAQDNRKTSRPTTTWVTEPNDPPIVAVQTKFIPKP